MNFRVGTVCLLLVVGFSSFSFATRMKVPIVKEILESMPKDELLKKIPQMLFEKIKQDYVPKPIKFRIPQNLSEVPIKNTIDPNEVTDALLEDIDEVIKYSGVDPYTLAAVEVFGISVQLSVGGFDDLHRNGDASMAIYDPYNYEFYSNVRVNGLYGKFALSFRFIGIHYEAGCDVTMDTADGDVDFTVSINPHDNATYIFVKSLESTNYGKISVNVYGLGPLNIIADVIATIFITLFKIIVPWFFDVIFLNIINQIAAVLFPPW